MGSREFIESCKLEVRKYAEEHLDKSDVMTNFDVYVMIILANLHIKNKKYCISILKIYAKKTNNYNKKTKN